MTKDSYGDEIINKLKSIMNEKINIAELLKDCPTGMKLDCTMYENVTFNRLQGDEFIIINKTIPSKNAS